jgi:hypothetical protein
MAIADLFEKMTAATSSPDGDHGDSDDVPDDASELMDDDLLADDPKPVRGRAAGRRNAPPKKLTIKQTRELRDQVLMMIEFPAGLWSMRDPVCAGAIQDQAETIADRLVPIIARSPAMLAWFTGSTAPYMDWFALAMALRPVASTVWAHHVSHSIGHQEEQDATDFSAYAAPAFSSR